MTDPWGEPHRLTPTDLDDPQWREALSQAIENWLPNHTDSAGRVDSYDDLLDRVEGDILVGGRWYHLTIGDATDEPGYLALRRLAQKIAKENRS